MPTAVRKVLLETEENNLLSMISDGKDLLYVGTDPHGLVYRVNRKTGESFVLYNAAESEVTALALDNQGNLYAATGEARDDTPAPGQNANEGEKNGRPEGGETGVPIPAGKPGEEPKPPAPPDPNPGRPDPIPKVSASPAAQVRLFLVRRLCWRWWQKSQHRVVELAGDNNKRRPHPAPVPCLSRFRESRSRPRPSQPSHSRRPAQDPAVSRRWM